ncbi:hypothetical protein SAMN05216206_2795 [Pseudomonas guineae]|uniref:Uncharacterized protein n=1 Tax=Pseudomonas guineae TaxID=425504 RepID=A0A1I3KE95_9PSED|nr:hypothetical protein [Pseudomonas guineae]SFI70714.1 hypothetical protein SAMN05216206_2795 [Pseudomonas guineae]
MSRMPFPTLIEEQLAAIEAGRVVERIAVSASSLLGAKSLAYQQGIEPRREPDFKYCSGGQWTLVYEARP